MLVLACVGRFHRRAAGRRLFFFPGQYCSNRSPTAELSHGRIEGGWCWSTILTPPRTWLLLILT
jgi:hypothetical protein